MASLAPPLGCLGFRTWPDPIHPSQISDRARTRPRHTSCASGHRGSYARHQVLTITPSVPACWGRSDAHRCRPIGPCRTAHDPDRHRGRSTTHPTPQSRAPPTLRRISADGTWSRRPMRGSGECQPRSISMIAEKSRPPCPCFSNRSKSWAASAPSGVAAPEARAASWASFRSFSIRAAAKPGL